MEGDAGDLPLKARLLANRLLSNDERYSITDPDTVVADAVELFLRLRARPDVRTILSATGRLRDGKEIDIPGPAFLRTLLMKKLDKTQIGALLREFGIVADD